MNLHQNIIGYLVLTSCHSKLNLHLQYQHPILEHQFKSYLLHFQSSFPLVHLKEWQKMAQVPDPCTQLQLLAPRFGPTRPRPLQDLGSEPTDERLFLSNLFSLLLMQLCPSLKKKKKIYFIFERQSYRGR